MLISFDCATISLLEVFLDKMKLCSILVFFVEISAKINDTFGYPNTILGKLGVTHDLG